MDNKLNVINLFNWGYWIESERTIEKLIKCVNKIDEVAKKHEYRIMSIDTREGVQEMSHTGYIVFKPHSYCSAYELNKYLLNDYNDVQKDSSWYTYNFEYLIVTMLNSRCDIFTCVFWEGKLHLSGSNAEIIKELQAVEWDEVINTVVETGKQ